MKSTDLGRLSDRDLLAAVRNMNVKTGGIHATLYGLTTPQTVAFGADLDDYQTALDDYDTAQTQKNSAFEAKNSARAAIITTTRGQMRSIRAKVGVTNQQLADAGLDIYDQTQTAASAPVTAPLARVEYEKLKHTIFFRDAANPSSEAKPKGARGAEIWRFVGDLAPTAQSDYAFVALDTASPYTVFYDLSQAGKNAFYVLRWLSTGGGTGAWSETVQATING